MESNKNSPNLEDVSKGHSQGREERRQLPRLSLGSEQFRFNDTHKIFSVTDLSQNGMGLWCSDREDIQFFSVGLLIEGVLNLKREKYPIQARIRNRGLDRIGCEFENLSSEAARTLSHYLDPKLLGEDLKPIPSTEMSTLWYHGPSGTDLLLKRSTDGQYSKLSLYVLNTYIQWERDQGLTTGRTKISDVRSEVRGIFRLETLLLQEDPTPDPLKLSIAKTVIMSSNLSQDLKSWCVRHFER